MGIDPMFVLPVKDHLAIFNCRLCSKMTAIDSYVTTSCLHMFCKTCFHDWIPHYAKSKTCDCPTCGLSILSNKKKCVDVTNVQVKPLSVAQPLAHHVLMKVKVLCPCRSNFPFCYWTGDYGSLDEHMSQFHPGFNEGKQAIKPSANSVSSRERNKKVSTGISMSKSSASLDTAHLMESLNVKSEHRYPKRSMSSENQNKKKRSSSDHQRMLRKSRSEVNPKYDNTLDPVRGRENESLKTGVTRSNSAPRRLSSSESNSAACSFSMYDLHRLNSDDDSPNQGSNSSRRRCLSSDSAQGYKQDLGFPKNPSKFERSREKSNDLVNDVGKVHVLQRKASKEASVLSGSDSPPEGERNSSTRSSSRRWLDQQALQRSVSPKQKHVKTDGGDKIPKRSQSRSKSRSNSPKSTTSSLPSTNKVLSGMKDMANIAFKAGQYHEAVTLYTEAIDFYVGKKTRSTEDEEIAATLYGNRAASYLKQEMFEPCLDDCESALALNNAMPRVCLRKAWALNEMGRLEQACSSLSKSIGDNPEAKELQEELEHTKKLLQGVANVKSLLANHHYGKAKKALKKMQQTNCSAILLMCQAELGLGNADAVIEAINTKLLNVNSSNSEALALLARAFFQNADCDKAIQNSKKSLLHSPDDSEVQANLRLFQDVHNARSAARSASHERNFGRAVKEYSKALKQCTDLPVKAVLVRSLRLERAQASVSAGNFNSALADTKSVLLLDQNCVAGWVTRVKAYQALRDYDSIASELCTLVGKLDNDFLKEAFDAALDPPEHLDYYALLGVSRAASTDEIKKMYKVKARESHPDKFMGQDYTDDERREAGERFKLLGEALSLLCDSFQRSLYDAGHDIGSIRVQSDGLRHGESTTRRTEPPT